MIDSPGMVLASGDMSDSSVALRNAIKIETLTDPVTPVEAILKRCPKQQMMLQVISLHVQTAIHNLYKKIEPWLYPKTLSNK